MSNTTKNRKYEYEKIIQQNCGQGWEDVSSYPANSRGLEIDRDTRQLLQHDFREYARMGAEQKLLGF